MADIYGILKKYYGYTFFRRGQEKIIRNILDGNDICAVMPTGAGKSICYQIPAIAFDGITIVVSPLISLMQDQVRSLISMGIRAAYLNSSLTLRQMDMAIRNAKKGLYKIIYVAPERLKTDSFADFAANNNISLIAVDEAHCISQWGHDFRPSYMEISDFVSMLPKRPVIAAFTATATERVKRDIKTYLGLNSPYTVTTGFDRENLYFGTYKPIDKMKFILDYVSSHKENSGIIYCSTRRGVDTVAGMLSENGYSALPYHAGMTDGERAFNQGEFIYDRAKIIVATSAFGMGINKPNVRYVIHNNMPQNMEEYYQQAGRAGRDGEPSDCILLYSGKDVKINEFLIKNSSKNQSLSENERNVHIKSELEKLKMMTFYSTSKTVCLRKRILEYFGESFIPPCGNCSICRRESRDSYSHIVFKSGTEKRPLVDEILLERLNKKRKTLALAAGVPDFAILGDSALKEIAVYCPQSIAQLSKISGMSELKIRRYGYEFLNVVKEYNNKHCVRP